MPSVFSFDCPSFLPTFLLDVESILNPNVDLEIQSPSAIHQGWDLINGTIWAFGGFGLDRHDRVAHKTIATFQRDQNEEECRPDGIFAEDRD
jgi:hypothetical protein